MKFADIPGNEDVKKALVSMADTGRVAHALLFYENEGCGALPLALAYFSYLNCRNRKGGDSCGECPSCRKIAKLIHPDLHFVYPVSAGSKVPASEKPTSDSYLKYWRELVLSNPYFLENELYEAIGIEGKSGNISVAESKAILDSLSLTSVEDGYKAVLVWLPEKMNAEAANRLLKIVEEPPEDTLFLFVTHAPEKVLQTIFSRCLSIRVMPLSKEDVAGELTGRFGVTPEEALVQASVSGGSIGQALHLLGDKADSDVFMDLFSDFMDGIFRRDLMSVLECSEQMAALDSREKQRAFCAFAGDCIRKIFMTAQKMDCISNVLSSQADFFRIAAGRCSADYCVKALSFFDKASSMIARNVNAKIVFCDLADRMFVSL
ncbi:MAG: ATP-binding protein [Candidatus Cryptobacteroides sp.]